jgi:hypothetical protein
MTPGTKRQAWKSLTIPTSAAQRRRLSLEIPARFAGENMRWQKTVDPGALENLYSENAVKGSVTKKDEGAAHSIQARSSLLQ